MSFELSRQQVADESKQQIQKFARREFEYANLEPEVQDVLTKLLDVLAEELPSDFAANFISTCFSRLVSFLPLTSLTGDDSEWRMVDDGFEVNSRCSGLIRKDGYLVHFLEARIWADVTDEQHPVFFTGTIVDAGSGVLHHSRAEVFSFPFYPKSFTIRVAQTLDGTYRILDPEILLQSYIYYSKTL